MSFRTGRTVLTQMARLHRLGFNGPTATKLWKSSNFRSTFSSRTMRSTINNAAPFAVEMQRSMGLSTRMFSDLQQVVCLRFVTPLFVCGALHEYQYVSQSRTLLNEEHRECVAQQRSALMKLQKVMIKLDVRTISVKNFTRLSRDSIPRT